jgi:hypothetical protein
MPSPTTSSAVLGTAQHGSPCGRDWRTTWVPCFDHFLSATADRLAGWVVARWVVCCACNCSCSCHVCTLHYPGLLCHTYTHFVACGSKAGFQQERLLCFIVHVMRLALSGLYCVVCDSHSSLSARTCLLHTARAACASFAASASTVPSPPFSPPPSGGTSNISPCGCGAVLALG